MTQLVRKTGQTAKNTKMSQLAVFLDSSKFPTHIQPPAATCISLEHLALVDVRGIHITTQLFLEHSSTFYGLPTVW